MDPQTSASLVDRTESQFAEPRRSEFTPSSSPVSLVGRSLKDLGALDSDSSMKAETLAALRSGAGGQQDFAAEFGATGRVKEHAGLQGIQIELHDGKPLLRDGRHRLTVAREQGRTTIYGQVYDGERAPGKAPIFEGEIPIAARERCRVELARSEPADRYELARFRQDINLIAFAASKGYAVDKRDSSRNCCMMRHANGDKIAIGKAADGHWQYYSFRDERDNGDIVEFVQQRSGGRGAFPLGSVRKELRQWTHTEREVPQFVPELRPVVKDRAAVNAAFEKARVVETHPHLEARALSPATLADPRFRGTWRMMPDRYGNVIFPHRDLEGLSGFEVKNKGFTSFAEGGDKGLWSSRTRPGDNRLVIAESAIDALSYHQLHPYPGARYVSFAGGLNPRQPELLERAIARMPPGSTIVAATDRDHDGDVFAKRIAAMCSEHSGVTFVRGAPKLGCKDWNDHLKEVRDRLREQARPSRHRGMER